MQKLLKEMAMAISLVLLTYIIPATILYFYGPEFMQKEIRKTIQELIHFMFNITK
jgi:hypothetical protein